MGGGGSEDKGSGESTGPAREILRGERNGWPEPSITQMAKLTALPNEEYYPIIHELSQTCLPTLLRAHVEASQSTASLIARWRTSMADAARVQRWWHDVQNEVRRTPAYPRFIRLHDYASAVYK